MHLSGWSLVSAQVFAASLTKEGIQVEECGKNRGNSVAATTSKKGAS